MNSYYFNNMDFNLFIRYQFEIKLYLKYFYSYFKALFILLFSQVDQTKFSYYLIKTFISSEITNSSYINYLYLLEFYIIFNLY
jgi:hypothetical protein